MSEIYHWCSFCQKSNQNESVSFMIASSTNGDHGICDVCLGIAVCIGSRKHNEWRRKLMLKIIDEWDFEG